MGKTGEGAEVWDKNFVAYSKLQCGRHLIRRCGKLVAEVDGAANSERETATDRKIREKSKRRILYQMR